MLCCFQPAIRATEPSGEVAFSKEVMPGKRIEVFKTQKMHVKMGAVEREKLLVDLPPGSRIIEPEEDQRFDFVLTTNGTRELVYSRNHSVAQLGNIPQSFEVFDVTMTADTLTFLFKENQWNYVRRIQARQTAPPAANEDELFYTDVISSGRIIVLGRLLSGTNEVPDIRVEYANGGASHWVRKDGKWREIRIPDKQATNKMSNRGNNSNEIPQAGVPSHDTNSPLKN